MSKDRVVGSELPRAFCEAQGLAIGEEYRKGEMPIRMVGVIAKSYIEEDRKVFLNSFARVIYPDSEYQEPFDIYGARKALVLWIEDSVKGQQVRAIQESLPGF